MAGRDLGSLLTYIGAPVSGPCWPAVSGVTADVAMCAEGQNVGGSSRANAAGLVRQRWLGSVRGDQFQAELANLARVDVGVLLFGLSDQRSDRLHFPALDVGDDFRIRRE